MPVPRDFDILSPDTVMKAVDVYVVGHFVGLARVLQHRRPEQGVEIDDVLADEMDLLGLRVLQQLLEIQAFLRAIVLEGRQVADRRVEPRRRGTSPP